MFKVQKIIQNHTQRLMSFMNTIEAWRFNTASFLNHHRILHYLMLGSFKTIIVLWLVSFSPGCSAPPSETAIRGTQTVYVDEGLYPLIVAERDTFMKLYKDATIEIKSINTREGIVKLLNNESEIFISTRLLNQEEFDFVKQNQIAVDTNRFCFDGIAAIVDSNSPLVQIELDRLTDVLLGRSPDYKAVLPQANSGVYEYIKMQALKGEDPVGIEIALTEAGVIDSVRGRLDRIGLVSYSVLADSSVKTIRIGVIDPFKAVVNFYEPHPAYFLLDIYPFSRLSYVFLHEVGGGLATGFTAFLVGNEGQRIVLDHKLAPAAVPVKLNHTQ